MNFVYIGMLQLNRTKASTSNAVEDDGEDVKVIDLGDPLPDIVVKMRRTRMYRYKT